jgi:hypothetical protein
VSLLATSTATELRALFATLAGGSRFGRLGLELLSQLTTEVGCEFFVVICELAEAVLRYPVVPAVTSNGLARSRDGSRDGT